MEVPPRDLEHLISGIQLDEHGNEQDEHGDEGELEALVPLRVKCGVGADDAERVVCASRGEERRRGREAQAGRGEVVRCEDG